MRFLCVLKMYHVRLYTMEKKKGFGTAPRQCGIHSKSQPLLQKTFISYASETLATYTRTCLRTHAIRTYVFHMLRTYVMILCNWLILWQNTLYLYLGRFRMCLNTSRNHVSRSSVEAFKSVQEIKQRVQIH